ncbi:protein FAR1-RELATED SEQUENCE 5-like [Cornus florida]|uniref:protein FAR1-RELATED SEQUENCE 5-like n=1 Tax=Cornus florida TaxID=4283 RepID=UPI00289C0CFB|nr:protein FAR1-RELATED SEQUENCE 5-like [Cornus florida]
MEFDNEKEAYDFYNAYGGRIGFSIRKEYGNKVHGRILSKVLVCSKEVVKGTDKWDVFRKTPRAKTRTNCGAKCHMMLSQRRISSVQAIDIELASDSGVPACNAYEFMGRQFGGKESVGYLKVDLKNYLRTRRQNKFFYGEAAWLVDYLETRACEDLSFFYSLQLDIEQMITNIFWSDYRMIIDYGHFGNVISFDTAYKVVHVMGGKAPKTIIIDQDTAMAKVLKQADIGDPTMLSSQQFSTPSSYNESSAYRLGGDKTPGQANVTPTSRIAMTSRMNHPIQYQLFE